MTSTQVTARKSWHCFDIHVLCVISVLSEHCPDSSLPGKSHLWCVPDVLMVPSVCRSAIQFKHPRICCSTTSPRFERRLWEVCRLLLPVYYSVKVVYL